MGDVWVIGSLWIAREWGILSVFSAFRFEGRHQSLKSEIRNRSFKGGSKKRGSRLRGARRALRKGWAEVLRNDNVDWGLGAKGFNVSQPSWTRQEAYGSAKKYWERVIARGSCSVSYMFVLHSYNFVVHTLVIWWWNTIWTRVNDWNNAKKDPHNCLHVCLHAWHALDPRCLCLGVKGGWKQAFTWILHA